MVIPIRLLSAEEFSRLLSYSLDSVLWRYRQVSLHLLSQKRANWNRIQKRNSTKTCLKFAENSLNNNKDNSTKLSSSKRFHDRLAVVKERVRPAEHVG